MRETENITVSLPVNLSNNNKRPVSLADDSDNSDDRGEEYFPPLQMFQKTIFLFPKNDPNITL